MTENDQKNISRILSQLEDIKSQLKRFESEIDSEKGTRRRINSLIIKKIEKVQEDVNNILYGEDKKSGIIVDIDRLKQLSIQVKALIGAVAAIIGKIIYDMISKK